MKGLLWSWAVLFLVFSILALTVPSFGEVVVSNGLTVMSGNTDSVVNRSAIEFGRGNFTLGSKYMYGREDNEKDNERIEVSQDYRHELISFLGEGFYYKLSSDFEYDYATNLDYQVRLKPGIVYEDNLINNMDFSLGGGVAYKVYKYSSESLSDDVLLHFNGKINYEPVGGVSIIGKIDHYPEIDNLLNYETVASSILKIDIYEGLSLLIEAESRYKSNPLVENKKNDLMVHSGLSYTF